MIGAFARAPGAEHPAEPGYAGSGIDSGPLLLEAAVEPRGVGHQPNDGDVRCCAAHSLGLEVRRNSVSLLIGRCASDRTAGFRDII